jgi:hypothetical protein
VAQKREVLEWGVLGPAKSVKTVVPDADHDYDLLNVKIGSAIVYGERTFGINLVWSDPYHSNNVRFARQDGKTTPIKYGQQVAINIRRGGWLVYKKRSVGINLGWSDSPRYEWRIDGGDPKDNVVIPGLIALHNSVENDWIMYVPREFGINLRWTADEDVRAWLRDATTLAGLIKKYYDKL